VSIVVIVMMEKIRSSETSVLTRDTLLNIPEVGILHSHAMKTSNIAEH
jgi:hypothetical protein